jgi:hypothetical protein
VTHSQVDTIMPQELCDGSWKDTALALVMPGGADVPYCQALNGRGNEHIKGPPGQLRPLGWPKRDAYSWIIHILLHLHLYPGQSKS